MSSYSTGHASGASNPANNRAPNQDPREIARFEATAQRWWDPQGEFRPLHDLNPIRTDYIDARARLAGKRVLDIGCGGGLLSESMAARGADVTGIDLGQTSLQVAELHALETGAKVRYLNETAEAHATGHPAAYDVVTCLEMLEHVPDPLSVIAAAATVAKPGGQLFFSTLNRNLKSYLLAVVGAEYALRLLPRGTHTYSRFIRPSELAGWARAADLQAAGMSGIEYNPLTRACRLTRNADVNYIMHFTRPALA